VPSSVTSDRAAVRAQGLSRSFGPTTALVDVSLAVRAGELLAVLGPNGAGKTTLLNILTGSVRPTSGTVSIDGKVATANDPRWRSAIGVVSHRSGLYGHLTAFENLRFFGQLHGLSGLEAKCREALDAVGLGADLNRPVREFSRGMAQRAAIARATLHEPSVLLFDEPFTGLDVEAVNDLEHLLGRLRKDRRAVVLVTHRAATATALADRILLLSRGRVVYQGSEFPRDDSVEVFLGERLRLDGATR